MTKTSQISSQDWDLSLVCKNMLLYQHSKISAQCSAFRHDLSCKALKWEFYSTAHRNSPVPVQTLTFWFCSSTSFLIKYPNHYKLQRHCWLSITILRQGSKFHSSLKRATRFRGLGLGFVLLLFLVLLEKSVQAKWEGTIPQASRGLWLIICPSVIRISEKPNKSNRIILY